jgi:tRNA-dihydrouridine synthase
LMKDKEKTLDIIKSISKILTIPFSIKSRTWIDNIDKSRQMEFLIEASDYCDKISVHSRTLKELYHWEWDRNFIYELKSKANKNCKIIWNWWIKSYEEINKNINKDWIMLDWIMIWQAAIGNPRTFTNHEPSIKEKIETAIEHLNLSAKFEIFLQNLKDNRQEKIYPDLTEIESIDLEKNIEKIHYTPLTFRKYFHQYLKWVPWWKEAKEICNKTNSYKWIIDILQNF